MNLKFIDQDGKSKVNIPSPTLRALWRTKWLWTMLGILAILYYGVLVPNSTAKLVAYKLYIGLWSLILSYVGTKALFDYISLSKLLREEKYDAFLGACILRGTVMGAFILGVMLGI